MDPLEPDAADPTDGEIGPPIKARALLESLGFKPVIAEFTDEQPGYRYDFGNWALEASVLTNRYFYQVMQFSGVLSDERSISMIDFALLLEVESYEQGVALIAYGIPSDFTPLHPTPWLEQGRAWEEHLPGRRERRLYQRRPQCHVDADWFRVASKKLRSIGQAADADVVFTLTYRDEILKFDLPGYTLVMSATGKSWPRSYRCRVQGLRHLSKRTPSRGVPVSIWNECLAIGNLTLKLELDPLAVPLGAEGDLDSVPAVLRDLLKKVHQIQA